MWPSAAHYSYLLRCFSGTAPTDPTSSLYSMSFRRTCVLGNRIYRHVSRIRYETSAIFHLGDTHSDDPPDILAFSLVIYFVVRSNVNEVPIPHLLKTIAQDATCYFLVIFTSHVVIMLCILLATVRISPQCTIVSLIPSQFGIKLLSGR